MFQIRVALVALAAAVLAGLGAFGSWRYMTPKLAAAQAQVTALQEQVKTAAEQRKLDQATLARLAQKNAAQARAAASARASVRSALAAQPEWAAQPVPKEVRDALDLP